MRDYLGWMMFLGGEFLALVVVLLFPGLAAFPMNPAFFILPMILKYGYDHLILHPQGEEEEEEKIPLENKQVIQELENMVDDGRTIRHRTFGDPMEYWEYLYPHLCMRAPAFVCDWKDSPHPYPMPIGDKYYLYTLPPEMTRQPSKTAYVLFEVEYAPRRSRVVEFDWGESASSIKENLIRRIAASKDSGFDIGTMAKRIELEI